MLYRAAYILPVTKSPISNGAILVREGLIVDVGTQAALHLRYPDEKVTSFDRAAIIPGLVNPHTHLELSNLAGKIVPKGTFCDWITQVIQLRNQWGALGNRRSVLRGIKECLAHGITCVGDISHDGLSAKILLNAGLAGVVFLEVLGFQENQVTPAILKLKKLLEAFPEHPDILPGLSPHAPYSTSPALYQQIIQLAGTKHPVATHLAETQAEVEFLESAGGPFRNFLEQRGVWEAKWRTPGISPAAYLKQLGVLQDGMLAVHLNQVTPEDIQTLAQAKVNAVICPGSNKWFGRHNSHVLDLLATGVNLSLATDSLASNKSLDMFQEMRLAQQAYPQISPEAIIQMATINGARALGLEHRLGSLAVGKRADLVVISLPEETSLDNLPHYIVDANPQIIKLILLGRQLSV